ncbi:MAG TPA: GAF domain-containing protein, partial [Anaerolineales bacterium]|nr:GAF domain-containing protein [Anaerolineales bacterium]
PYQDAALHGLIVTSSLPVYDDFNRFRGVIAADIQLVEISKLINSIRFAQTGYAFLLDGEGRVIAMPDSGYADLGLSKDDFQGDAALEPILAKVSLEIFDVLIKMTTGQSGMRQVVLNGVDKYVAYQPIPSIGYSLGIIVPVSETQARLVATRERLASESSRTLINVIASTIALLAGALLVSRWMGNMLAKPLVRLTGTATRLAEGDLSAEAQSEARDEIGVLANAFNIMTSRLRELVTSLEQRVAERTADLEATTIESITRAEELQAVSEVARAISTETSFENLLTLVTNVVSKRFGFYHVGVFLLDNINNNAILRAANSPGGKRMVANGHKLPIGQVGIVGHVAASGEARIALDVGEDAAYFNNPDLPETRSEMALPLSLRGRIIGVLDVQSTQPNAFTTADIETLSILADQVAIAIENARLLDESRQALSESQSQYGEFVSRAWEQKTAKAIIGYQHSSGAGHMIEEPAMREEIQTALSTGRPAISDGKDTIPSIAVPIRLQDQVIGILNIRSTEPGRVWTQDEIAVVEAIAERLALALENARLFEETSSRASREHAVAEITSKIRETNDPQAMIRTAIQELQRVLNVRRVEIIPQIVSAHLPGRENDNQGPR